MERIDKEQLTKLGTLDNESKNVIVLSTSFNPKEKLDSIPPANYHLTSNSISLIKECVRALRFGGLLFVYGLPHQLALWGEYLSDYHDNKTRMLFKYWISLDIDEAPRKDTLEPTSLGLLMFLKSKSDSKTPTPFNLNTSTVRTPYAYCSACEQNVKDWGGKKYLINPNVIAMWNVWQDSARTQV